MSDRFKDLKNGIIHDAVTGLEWQAEPTDPMPWQDAIDYAAALDLGGHTDWRIPTIEELITLIDYSRTSPASSFPDMPFKWFWSSSSDVCFSIYAWIVIFNDGYVHNYAKNRAIHARCVRGRRFDPVARIAELETEVERLRSALTEKDE